MLLYHGTTLSNAENIAHNGIDIAKSHIRTDFGHGFYATPDRTCAVNWAIKKSQFERPGVVYLYFDEKQAVQFIRTFRQADLTQAQFVVNNRNGRDYVKSLESDLWDNNLDKQYDIVCGPICDGKIAQIARQIAAERRCVTEKDLKEMTSKDYPFQYSFHTLNAFTFITPIKVIRP